MEGRKDPAAESQLAALDRLLEQAATHDDPRSRADAIEAVAQRTVFVCSIPGTQPAEPRVLMNSKGEVGLPIYTRMSLLEEGARLYGWVGPDGQVDHIEMGARQAFQFARDRAIHAVVIDCGCDHALEIVPGEWPQPQALRRSQSSSQSSLRSSSTAAIRPPGGFSSGSSSRPPPPTGGSSPGMVPAVPPGTLDGRASDPLRQTGAGATVGRPADPLQQTGRRPTSSSSGDLLAQTGSQLTQGAAAAGAGPSVSQSSTNLSAVSRGAMAPPPGSLPSTTTRAIAVGGDMEVEVEGKSLQLTRPRVAPSDAQKDALSDVLRGYPEVEWASFLAIAQSGSEPELGVGVRLDGALRKRFPEIESSLREGAQKASIAGSLPVLSLERPDVMRFVRSAGIPFFPWKK